MGTKLALRRASGIVATRLVWLTLLLGVGAVLQNGFASGGLQSAEDQSAQDQSAQDQDDPPPRGAVRGAAQPLEAGPQNHQIGRLRGPAQIMELNARFGNRDRSYSRMTRNGVTTTDVKEGDLEIKIEETPDGIFMEIGRSYTRDDLDQLRSSHPELAKALEAFPTEVDGYHAQLSVRAVKKFEAINEDDLKEEHPEAYEQYERLVKQNTPQGGSGLGGFGLGGFGIDFEIQELNRFPNVRGLREQQEEMRREIEKMMERIR